MVEVAQARQYAVVNSLDLPLTAWPSLRAWIVDDVFAPGVRSLQCAAVGGVGGAVSIKDDNVLAVVLRSDLVDIEKGQRGRF